MSTGNAYTRESDLLHLSWLKARSAGLSTREIAETAGVSAKTDANVTSSIRNRDLEAIHSNEFPITGEHLQAELEDHAAKYWSKKTGALGSK